MASCSAAIPCSALAVADCAKVRPATCRVPSTGCPPCPTRPWSAAGTSTRSPTPPSPPRPLPPTPPGRPDASLVCCGHEYTLANAAFARVVDPDNAALQRRHEEAATMRAQGVPTLPSTLGQERDCNPFLRIDAPAVRAALAARRPAAASDRVEAFAELRRWKDGFGA